MKTGSGSWSEGARGAAYRKVTRRVQMPAIVCLAGPAGPEKSELLWNLAAELGGRGVKVAVIDDEPLELPQGRRGVAGAACLSGGRLGLWLNAAELGLLEVAERFFPEADLVLSAALSQEKRPKLEFCPEGQEPTLLDDPGLRAIVGRVQGVDKPVFDPQNLADLADFVQSELITAGSRRKVRVILGGRNLPIKGFVQDIVGQTVRAMISSLKGGDRPGRLEIYVD